MNGPKVSVILPFWNAADTLPAAIDSVQNQTFRDWELILIDDGSADDSHRIARSFEQRDSRIHLLRTPHSGIVKSLQVACGHAQGRYLARMDADNVAYPSRLEKQFRLMETDSAIGLCGAHVKMMGDKIGMGRRRYERWINGLVAHDAIVRELFVECPIAHPTFFMRRDAYETIGGYHDRGWPEDYDLCMRCWLAGVRFAKIDEVLLEWHDRPNRLSMADSAYCPEQFRALKRHYLELSHFAALSGRRFYQWGAGEVGKVWLREWGHRMPEAVVDINPRKIGRRIHEVPVVDTEELPAPGQVFVIVAVGAPGAREEIRQFLTPRGYVEGTDYRFVA